MTDVKELRITLTVDDFDAAVRLYRDALGLPEIAEVRFALRVPDADAMATTLIESGASAVAPAVDTPWGDRNARVAAPDGLQLTLFTPGQE
jgi:hypothetical protein